MHRAARHVSLLLALILTVSAAIVVPAAPVDASSSRGQELTGLFRLTAGAASGTRLKGSWFRMLQPGASLKTGPFMTNANSTADKGLATLLQPGSAGGFRTGHYQPQPNPAFDPQGNSLADSITEPTEFFNVKFSISTNAVDPQTKTACAPPVVVAKNGKLSADLSSWAASWNNQNFNQGAPKPVPDTAAKSPGQQEAQAAWNFVSQQYLGAQPAATVTGAGATGTFNPATGAFTLQWTSVIVGGPFNGFTGLWHLAGVFKATGRSKTS